MPALSGGVRSAVARDSLLHRLLAWLRDLATPGPLWSFRLFEARPGGAGFDPSRPVKTFCPRRLRRRRDHRHTQADPFLFVAASFLYIFFEVQETDRFGHIRAMRTADLQRFEELGPVLQQDFHISYPQVIATGGSTYMVPETLTAGEVALYEFDDFPTGLVRRRALLTGEYSDPTLHFERGLWWLFATTARGLELFFSTELASGSFVPHPANPIVTDPRVARCAGPLFRDGDLLVRPAQCTSVGDGSNIRTVAVRSLTTETYSEAPAPSPYVALDAGWNSLGSHHVSFATFAGRSLVAIDGRRLDYRLNRLIGLLFRLFSR